MSEIKIEKVKFKSDKLEVDYLVTLADNSHVSRSEERDTKVHPDLVDKLNHLRMHLAVLTDYREVKNAKAAGLEEFVVTGYSIGGKEEGEGVVISGYKLTKRGKAVILNTPFERLQQEESTSYYFLKSLIQDLEALEVEVLAYLDGSKKAPEPQLPLFTEDDNHSNSNTEGTTGAEADDDLPADTETADTSTPRKTSSTRKKKHDKK